MRRLQSMAPQEFQYSVQNNLLSARPRNQWLEDSSASQFDTWYYVLFLQPDIPELKRLTYVFQNILHGYNILEPCSACMVCACTKGYPDARATPQRPQQPRALLGDSISRDLKMLLKCSLTHFSETWSSRDPTLLQLEDKNIFFSSLISYHVGFKLSCSHQ